MEGARAGLGDAEIAAAMETGRRLSVDDAIAEVLAMGAPAESP
jgi:hypothetical protein